MKVIETDINDICIIEPAVFGDQRGWFMESYSYEKLKKEGTDFNFIQDNHSFSAQKGVLRGLHFQQNPKAQTKLIRCTRGKILDVAVDIREGSPTYLKWIAVVLSEENKKQLLVPKGFAHGFVTLTENVEVQYKVDNGYSPEHDCSIRYDDPQLDIDWGIINPLLSEKDSQAPLLKDCEHGFKY
ncbi:dTDP-4-dehydrorhamnose 3,5-epimerase [Alkalicoccus urumqiensis]|uniref:dTDP-4-dehydrorhamnose 3,5-epimerase n=1 Tax=Alkalicoccus urumqiensis TaxID=1548213 RepID=A0A2P6MHS0_ALKUR|nr:dTDP-4-dehydrorhamnose 3,5-epimerase [Alkalicoccus urumqiensis]PRO65839.1 dTDP-4-dehydrorhamnose 3,5-epimerase [Alkalicoccus urumqiensis]